MELIINSGEISKAHSTDAGIDIHSAQEYIIPPLQSESISTNLTIKLPSNTVGLVKPRSGLAFKFNLDTMAGVIDETYTGEIKVLLINHGPNPYHILKGEKVAQLLIVPICHPAIVTNNDSIYHSPENELRGSKGFGDSGRTAKEAIPTICTSTVPFSVKQNKAKAPKDSFATNKQTSTNNKSPTSMVDNTLDAVGDMLNILD